MTKWDLFLKGKDGSIFGTLNLSLHTDEDNFFILISEEEIIVFQKAFDTLIPISSDNIWWNKNAQAHSHKHVHIW